MNDSQEIVTIMREITELKELKEIELDIMRQVHEFCCDNNIRYCLGYGTLLGAIRHKGFIPWDDDIDILLYRDDYEKFKKEFPLFGKTKNLYIATYDSKPYFPRDMIKVCDARTELTEREFKYQDKFGVFVDVWPLDGAPTNLFVRKIHNLHLNVLRRIFEAGIAKTPTGSSGVIIIKMILSFIARIAGIDRLLKRRIYLAKKYKVQDSEIVECYNDHLSLCHFNKTDFDSLVLSKFEDTEFFIPQGYDNILTKRYGDYMKPPSIEMQKPHHVIDVFWKDSNED